MPSEAEKALEEIKECSEVVSDSSTPRAQLVKNLKVC